MLRDTIKNMIVIILQNGALKIIDRKKHIFKLAQGEYLAPEKIENVYQRSSLIAQCFLDGNSLEVSKHLWAINTNNNVYSLSLGIYIANDATTEKMHLLNCLKIISAIPCCHSGA